MKYSNPSTASLGLPLLFLTITVLADGDNCIKFKGDNSYTWKADGDFATAGDGKIDDSPHCFGPGSGGISFGAPNAPSGASGNTRLECHFPSSETDADFFNCNLSLVDGFSAAVTCSVAGGGWPNSNDVTAPLGCGYDILSSCSADDYHDGCKCCKNKMGASANSVDAVAPEFQKCQDSHDNPNSAELYHSMTGAFKFSKSDFPITCTVGKGVAPKVKRVVDAHHHSHAHGHARGQQLRRGPVHAREVKSRSLAEALS